MDAKVEARQQAESSAKTLQQTLSSLQAAEERNRAELEASLKLAKKGSLEARNSTLETIEEWNKLRVEQTEKETQLADKLYKLDARNLATRQTLWEWETSQRDRH